MTCRVCKNERCETYAKRWLDAPRSCSICALPMRHSYLGGPFGWSHVGEVIAWKCEACDRETPVGVKERRSEREK